MKSSSFESWFFSEERELLTQSEGGMACPCLVGNDVVAQGPARGSW